MWTDGKDGQGFCLQEAHEAEEVDRLGMPSCIRDDSLMVPGRCPCGPDYPKQCSWGSAGMSLVQETLSFFPLNLQFHPALPWDAS